MTPAGWGSDVQLADFSQIVLSSDDLRWLKRLARGEHLLLPKSAGNSLRYHRMVSFDVENGKRSENDPAAITDRGKRYLEYYRSNRRERWSDKWWTRGLAIAAILLSLTALALEFQDRGLLPFIGSAPKSEAQSPPDQ